MNTNRNPTTQILIVSNPYMCLRNFGCIIFIVFLIDHVSADSRLFFRLSGKYLAFTTMEKIRYQFPLFKNRTRIFQFCLIRTGYPSNHGGLRETFPYHLTSRFQGHSLCAENRCIPILLFAFRSRIQMPFVCYYTIQVA